MNFIKQNRICLGVSLIHWVLTFFTDRLIFVRDEGTNDFNYLACKAILFFILFFLWKTVLTFSPDTKELLKYAFFYLIVLAVVMVFKLPQGYLSNDENLIFEEAVHLRDYTWFSYLTTWYYILSLMLIPVKYAPIFVKVAVQALAGGYTVKRMVSFTAFKYGIFSYVPYLFFPVLAYTTSAHRIPVYFLIYAVLFVKLLFDKAEKKEVSQKEMFFTLLTGAILTQWRTEGIYLIIILPILILLTYPGCREKSALIKLLALFFLLQYLVSAPQNGVIPGRMGDKANNRMAPFYAYTITNMLRNGLDRDKNSESLKKVGRYLNLNEADRLNGDLKDINYEDVLILYYPGYNGVRSDITPEDYNAYTEGCKEIFINNPDVFFITRCGAFKYAALPYHIGTDSGGIKGLLKLMFSIVKAGFYNLFIPHVLLVLCLIISLIKRRWFAFFASAGLAGHFFIVFVLAPASYFKYYFPVYFMVYLYASLLIITEVYDRVEKKEKRLFI